MALTLWLCTLAGKLTLPTNFDPLAWHRHEMLFGFVGAVIAGFLLTAIPNWTGRLPIAGKPLLGLFGLWLSARIAVLFSAQVGALPAAVLDAGFFVVLAGLAAREVLEANNRNMATMILAVMTRASLGHTGRELRANPATVSIYVLVTAGAILRVSVALGLGEYRTGMDLAGTAWAAALLLFLVAYAPVLWKARLGDAAA